MNNNTIIHFGQDTAWHQSSRYVWILLPICYQFYLIIYTAFLFWNWPHKINGSIRREVLLKVLITFTDLSADKCLLIYHLRISSISNSCLAKNRKQPYLEMTASLWTLFCKTVVILIADSVIDAHGYFWFCFILGLCHLRLKWKEYREA